MINRKKLQIKSCSDNRLPYPNGQADGFAFSTKEALPPMTLRIVFDELERTGFGRRYDPNLQDWATQGVMLLNTILTCTYKETLSHKGWGWERFIGKVLDEISKIDHPFVVMGWGRHAQDLIKQHILFDGVSKHGLTPLDTNRLYLTSIHPVAQSYSNGSMLFVGCGHFEKANLFLEQHGMDEIQWNNPKLQIKNSQAITNAN